AEIHYNADAVKRLLPHMYLNYRDNEGATVAMRAAESVDAKTIEKILNKGYVDVTLKDYNGNNFLNYLNINDTLSDTDKKRLAQKVFSSM
ncbi:MAG: hypothetical protein IJ233_14180, partial [Pyramidobacter sp.]|nr:hypothetical protein [Pyramidobacter sp.]